MTSSEMLPESGKPGVPPTGSLKGRALSAGGWLMFDALATMGFRVASNLIMTRLLVPEAFGVMAVATVILGALQMLSDIGISRSVSRELDGEDDRFLRVTWVVRILRSLMIAAALVAFAIAVGLLAPLYAPEGSVYAAPELPGLLALVGLAPVLDGLASTSRELTIRRMQNRRFAIISLFSKIISIATMIVFALVSPTVWALMAGLLTSSLIASALTHIALPGPRMRFEWDREIATRLWTFGRWIMASSALTFIARSVDKLLLAGLLSATTFGLYVIAQIWIEAGRSLVNRLSVGVGFPAMAEVIRTRPSEVARLYRKFQTVIDVVCLFGFLATLLLGRLLIDFLYTDTYELAGHYLQLMSPFFLVARFSTLGDLIVNFGDSKSTFIIAALRSISALTCVPLGYFTMGVEGAILASILSPMLALPYIFYRASQFLTRAQVSLDAAVAIGVLGAMAAVFIVVP